MASHELMCKIEQDTANNCHDLLLLSPEDLDVCIDELQTEGGAWSELGQTWKRLREEHSDFISENLAFLESFSKSLAAALDVIDSDIAVRSYSGEVAIIIDGGGSRFLHFKEIVTNHVETKSILLEATSELAHYVSLVGFTVSTVSNALDFLFKDEVTLAHFLGATTADAVVLVARKYATTYAGAAYTSAVSKGSSSWATAGAAKNTGSGVKIGAMALKTTKVIGAGIVLVGAGKVIGAVVVVGLVGIGVKRLADQLNLNEVFAGFYASLGEAVSGKVERKVQMGQRVVGSLGETVATGVDAVGGAAKAISSFAPNPFFRSSAGGTVDPAPVHDLALCFPADSNAAVELIGRTVDVRRAVQLHFKARA